MKLRSSSFVIVAVLALWAASATADVIGFRLEPLEDSRVVSSLAIPGPGPYTSSANYDSNRGGGTRSGIVGGSFDFENAWLQALLREFTGSSANGGHRQAANGNGSASGGWGGSYAGSGGGGGGWGGGAGGGGGSGSGGRSSIADLFDNGHGHSHGESGWNPFHSGNGIFGNNGNHPGWWSWWEKNGHDFCDDFCDRFCDDDDDDDGQGGAAVPEPTTMLLLGGGLLAVRLRRRRG